MRFGGYTEKTWNGNDEAKKDENNNGFCYSLDLFKIYNNIKEAKSLLNVILMKDHVFMVGIGLCLVLFFL